MTRTKKTLLAPLDPADKPKIRRHTRAVPGRAKPRRKKRASPKTYKPTKEARLKVSVAVASRLMTQIQIADMLGISHGTLQKHFAKELSRGFATRNFEVIEARYKAAVAGNASAQSKWLDTAFKQPQFMIPDAPATKTVEPKKPKLGKKAQALEDAHNPDVSTSIGSRMAQRMSRAGITQH